MWRCYSVASCGVAGIVWLAGSVSRIEPVACRIMSDRVAIVFAWVMRLGDSGLRSIIGIGDYLNLSVAFPSLNKKPDFGCFPAFWRTC